MKIFSQSLSGRRGIALPPSGEEEQIRAHSEEIKDKTTLGSVPDPVLPSHISPAPAFSYSQSALLRLPPSARGTGTLAVPVRIAGLRPGGGAPDGLFSLTQPHYLII